MSGIAAGVAISALSACASVSARPPTVLTLDGAECQPLGPVQGTGSAGPNVLRDTQIYWARRDALGLAAAKGATHVVLTQETQDPGHLNVLGYAYRCR